MMAQVEVFHEEDPSFCYLSLHKPMGAGRKSRRRRTKTKKERTDLKKEKLKLWKLLKNRIDLLHLLIVFLNFITILLLTLSTLIYKYFIELSSKFTEIIAEQ